MPLQQLYDNLKRSLGKAILVVVSKTRTVEEILALYALGQRDFGENKVQELLEKKPRLPKDIRWHFIGRLQKNKVNKLIGEVFLIHSVDSIELAEKISKASEEKGNATAVLLQVNTSGEGSKQGFSKEELEENLDRLKSLSSLQIQGLMTMAPFTEDPNTIRHAFSNLAKLRDRLLPGGELSMGMSHDYLEALKEGATLVRIGSLLFGERQNA